MIVENQVGKEKMQQKIEFRFNGNNILLGREERLLFRSNTMKCKNWGFQKVEKYLMKMIKIIIETTVKKKKMTVIQKTILNWSNKLSFLVFKINCFSRSN